MAAFLTRAYDYRATQAGQGALPAGGDYFDDDNTQSLQAEINKAAAAGFTGGVAPLAYRPADPVRRDQMASFLARVLDLIVQNGMTTVPAPPAPPQVVVDPAAELAAGRATPRTAATSRPGGRRRTGSTSTTRTTATSPGSTPTTT